MAVQNPRFHVKQRVRTNEGWKGEIAYSPRLIAGRWFYQVRPLDGHTATEKGLTCPTKAENQLTAED